MGADLCLTGIPVFEVTPERLQEIDSIIDQLTDDDFREAAPPSSDNLERWQAELRAAVKILDGIENLRDVSRWYDWWLSGGLSWGEDPTESFSDLALIYDCDPLLTKLLSWSQVKLAEPRG